MYYLVWSREWTVFKTVFKYMKGHYAEDGNQLFSIILEEWTGNVHKQTSATHPFFFCIFHASQANLSMIDPMAFTDKLEEWLLSDKKKMYFPMSLWVQFEKRISRCFRITYQVSEKKYKMWLEIWISRKQINLEKNCFLRVWNYMSNHPQFFKYMCIVIKISID